MEPVDPIKYVIVPRYVDCQSRVLRLIYGGVIPALANLNLADENSAKQFVYDELKRVMSWLEKEGVRL